MSPRPPRSSAGGVRRRRRWESVRRSFRIGSIAADIDEELAFHFDRTVEELVERGYHASRRWMRRTPVSGTYVGTGTIWSTSTAGGRRGGV